MNRPDEQDYVEKLEARVKELESFIEGLKENLKNENLSYNLFSELNQVNGEFKINTKYILFYKNKPLKEWEREYKSIEQNLDTEKKECLKLLEQKLKYIESLRKINKLLKDSKELPKSFNYTATDLIKDFIDKSNKLFWEIYNIVNDSLRWKG